MRACLPRTGLLTTAAPVRSAMARVVPIATVLLTTVRVGPEKIDVPRRFANEVFDLEWKADMQNVGLFDSLRGRNVDSDYVMLCGKKVEEGLAHLSESGDNNFSFFHALEFSFAKSNDPHAGTTVSQLYAPALMTSAGRLLSTNSPIASATLSCWSLCN